MTLIYQSIKLKDTNKYGIQLDKNYIFLEENDISGLYLMRYVSYVAYQFCCYLSLNICLCFGTFEEVDVF